MSEAYFFQVSVQKFPNVLVVRLAIVKDPNENGLQ